MSHRVLDYSYSRFSPAQVHNLGTTVGAIAALNPGLITDVNHVEAGWNIQVR